MSLEPRKSPVQTRSVETVAAIRQAAVQLLSAPGGSRITTTEIAQRAGVSVGTLYQYFPNKQALLHSIMSEHLEAVIMAVEAACREQRGRPLAVMVEALIDSFVDAKLQDSAASVSLYAIADGLEAKPILRRQQVRARKAITALLLTVPGVRFPQLETTVLMMYSSMAGTMRAVLEAGAGKALVEAARREMKLMVEGHLLRASLPTRRGTTIN